LGAVSAILEGDGGPRSACWDSRGLRGSCGLSRPTFDVEDNCGDPYEAENLFSVRGDGGVYTGREGIDGDVEPNDARFIEADAPDVVLSNPAFFNCLITSSVI
jgi:hypothetical protein